MVEPFGSPVYAADDGVVALVGSSSSGYGNFVVIAHSGGLDTLYGHLSVALVKLGDRVAQGQPIGLEGSTGNSTGAHLHFELRINQKPVDPTPYLPPGAPSSFKG
jgi:murein DD-endopeptidase MepM/ murein hydrolase activator NlpD